MIFSIFLVQTMTLANGLFLILPVFCWYPVRTFNMLRELTKFEAWFWIGGIELLVSVHSENFLFVHFLFDYVDYNLTTQFPIQVLSFFHRIFLTGLLLALLAYEYIILKGSFNFYHFSIFFPHFLIIFPLIYR